MAWNDPKPRPVQVEGEQRRRGKRWFLPAVAWHDAFKARARLVRPDELVVVCIERKGE